MRLFEQQQFAGLFITHSISEAVFLSTRVLVMSPRPGRIVAEIEVPFPYPRDPDLRFDPAFAAISAEVSHVLRAGGSMSVPTPTDPSGADSGRRRGSARPHRSAARPCCGGPWRPSCLRSSCSVLVIGLWYFVSYVVLDRRRQFLLHPPHEVVREGFLDRDNLAEILDGVWSSMRVAAIGLAVSIVLGVAIAVLMSQAKVIERAWFPFLVTLQAIPILALVPMIQFWFGTDWRARVLVCVIISFFPIVLNTLFGLLSADPGLHDLITLHQADAGRDSPR